MEYHGGEFFVVSNLTVNVANEVSNCPKGVDQILSISGVL